MKGKKKITLFTLIVMFVLTCTFGLVACTQNGDGTVSAKEAIERYLLPENGTLVSENFTLPKKIGKDDAITVVDATDKYTAQVTLQAQITDVKLTISAEGNSKDFTVRVDELTPFTFMQKYSFKQEGTAVNADFDLETKTEFQGHEATITWTVEDEASQAFLEVKEEGGKTKLHIKALPEDLTSVKLHGVFIFNNKKAFKDYSFSLSPKLEHRQQVNRFYSITDYPLELSGYITHVVEASESYGNATFYMIDDDFCSGYYCYRVTIDKADVDKYVEGAHVTVTGDRTKNYNGLWENNSGGKATVDNKPAIDPREKVYALDTDLLAGAPSMLWHESTFVSLIGWKVSAKAEKKPTKGTTGTLFTLKKGDAEIAVAYTKYATYKDNADVALIDLYDTIKVDDVVNVTGLLGCYNTANGGAFDPNKFQIQPLSASDITVVTTGEVAYENGAKIKAAIAEVEEKVEQNFSALIASDKTVTMPTTKDGVTISYRLAGYEHLTTPTVKIGTKGEIANGSFEVKPNDTNHSYDIEVTYKIGDYEAYSFFKLRNWKRTGAQLVELVKESINSTKLEKITEAGDVALPVDSNYGTTVTWKVKEPTTVPEWATIKDGHTLSIAYLPVEETKLTLEATITLGTDSSTVELKVTVPAVPKLAYKGINAAAAGDYRLGLYQGTLDQWLYSSGAISTNSSGDFGATVTDYAKAAIYTLTASGTDGWTIKLKSAPESAAKDNVGKFLELNSNHRISYVAAATSVWKWNAEHKVFTFTVGSDTYYLGTYSTFNTISASTLDRLGDGNYAAYFGEMKEATDKDWADELLGKMIPSEDTFAKTGDISLPTTKQYNAVVTWTVKTANAEYFELTGSTLKIKKVPATGTQQVTLTVSVKVNDTTSSRDVVMKVKDFDGDGTEQSPYSVADVKILAPQIEAAQSTKDAVYWQGTGDSPLQVHIKGVVTDKGTYNEYKGAINGLKDVIIADKSGDTVTLKVSFLYYDNTVMKKINDNTNGKTNPLHVGDEVVVYGFLESYKHGTTTVYSSESVYPTLSKWTPKTLTNQEMADEVLESLALTKSVFDKVDTTGIALPTSDWHTPTIAWAVKGTSNNVTVENNTLKINTLPTEGTVDVTLTVTVTVGTGADAKSATKDVTITLKAALKPGDEYVSYTVDGLVTGSNNSYGGNSDVTIDGVKWNVEGNANAGAGNPWRLGGKSLTNQDRKITGKTAVTGKITKLVIKFGEDSGSNNSGVAYVTVNSVTLKIYKSDPTVAGATATYTHSITYTANGEFTVTAPAGEDWTNCFYQIVVNLTISDTSKNRYISIASIDFYSVVPAATPAALLPRKDA